jgi:ABC-2 type transport system permease protein
MSYAERRAALAQEPMISTIKPSSLSGTWASLEDVLRHRELLALLVRRDLKSKYKDSALGFLWSLVRPLTQLLVYYVVLGKFLGAERGIPDFAVYVFSGLTAYGLFSEIVVGGTSSILGNAGLIKKIALPREVFPLATVGSALFNFVMQLVILLIACLALGKFPLGTDLLYVIPGVLLLVVYGFAFGLLLSALNVYLRDIAYIVEVVMLLLLWGSPIVYAWSQVAHVLGNSPLANIYTSNPITLGVLCFHKAFWVSGAATPYPALFELRCVVAIAIGFVLVFIAQRVFSRLQGNFAQEI